MLDNKGIDTQPLEQYQNINTKILHVCGTCNTQWKAAPRSVIKSKGGCTSCGKMAQVKSNNDYIMDIDRYDVKCIGTYVNNSTPIAHKCTICDHIWNVRPNDILRGQGCPKCKPSRYSKISIDWLNSIDVNLQTAINGGEYTIPQTRYKVDGYDHNSNTAYEFLGNCWHGNPSLYDANEQCHPFSNKTSSELYNETMERLQHIEKLGHIVVFIWEQEYVDSIN
jgi:predicted  nucleic acid-binding Zn-ribbon protein